MPSEVGLKITWRDFVAVAIAVTLAWWLMRYQDWSPWWAAGLGVMLFTPLRQLLKVWSRGFERLAMAAKLKELEAKKVTQERKAAEAVIAESEQLAAEAQALAAEAQIRPAATPANIQTNVSIRTNSSGEVTLNGIRNPEGIWVATRSVGIGSSNTLIHQGSIIVFDGRRYHGQDGVIDVSPTQIRAAFREGWFRRIEDPLDAPDAALSHSTLDAAADFGRAIQSFGSSIGRRPGRRGQVQRATKGTPKPKEEPQRRSSWERLDDDEF